MEGYVLKMEGSGQFFTWQANIKHPEEPGGQSTGQPPGQPAGQQNNSDNRIRQSILDKIAFRQTDEFKSIFSKFNVFTGTSIYFENNFTEEEKSFIYEKANERRVPIRWSAEEGKDKLFKGVHPRDHSPMYYEEILNHKRYLDLIRRWID